VVVVDFELNSERVPLGGDLLDIDVLEYKEADEKGLGKCNEKESACITT
jgi:hypothetical protein